MRVSPPDPVVLSWSGLKRWENCPQHHLRVIKRETKKSEMGRVFLPGTVCDLVQRRWLESDHPEPGEMAQMVEDVMREVVDRAEAKIHWKGNPTTDYNAVAAHCRRVVAELEPWLVQNVLPYGYSPEFKFRANFELPYVCNQEVRAPVRLIGGMDIIVQYEDEKFGLFDLKITENDSYIRSTLGQLTFYDLAWSIIQGSWDSCRRWAFVTPLLPEKTIEVVVTEDDRNVMLSRIAKYAEGAWTASWDPKKDDTGCGYCEAKLVCPKFTVVSALTENGKMKSSFSETAARRRKQQ